MTLFDQISEDIKKAMLAKDKVALDALRGVKKEFLEAKTAKGGDGELQTTKLFAACRSSANNVRRRPKCMPLPDVMNSQKRSWRRCV